MTAAAVTLDAVADESWKKMADGVARSPSWLCSRDGKICCYGDALSTIFLLACFFCALLPTFRFSFSFVFCNFLSLSVCPSVVIVSQFVAVKALCDITDIIGSRQRYYVLLSTVRP